MKGNVGGAVIRERQSLSNGKTYENAREEEEEEESTSPLFQRCSYSLTVGGTGVLAR